MHDILRKENLAEDTYRMVVRAPRIAQKRKAGQFVILRVSQAGERVPLTIADVDLQELSITIVFQVAGESTRKLMKLEPGDELVDLVGPLGHPTDIADYHHAVCVGGGLGIALVWPLARALRATTNRLTGIVSARNDSLLILEDEMRQACDSLIVATDDGSRGHHGFPTEVLQDLIDAGGRIDAVYAVGPVPMMAAISEVTRPHAIKTIVSLNPIMLDGTGMCGGCRVTVGGKTKFACVDGPEFDGHLVDFRELSARLKQYDAEPVPLPHYQSGGGCDRRHTELQEAMLEAGRKAEKARDIPRQPMPEQSAEARVRNFDEVPLGLSPDQAVVEASRCLQCKSPKCVDGCPVGVDIPGFIKLIAERDFAQAAARLKEDNALPAICGRVCPQEVQCEDLCVMGKRGDPVAIGNLERFVADYEREHGLQAPPVIAPAKGKRVAIVGSGPAGLTAAGELARMGYEPVIFEALHETGGVLTYGIPPFRLPKEDVVAREVDFVRSLGAEVQTNFVVGKTATIQELFDEGFEAVFVGTGAGLPMMADVPGENLNGVLSANEYLTRSNLMRAHRADHATPVLIKRRVAVLGGGNVAMDSARTAVRLGAEEVTIVYRRSEQECPARAAELEHAMEEGVRIMWLTSAVEVLGDEKDWVQGLRCIKMRLGEPGADGRRRPSPIDGTEFDMRVELVIVAYGNRPHPLIPRTTEGLKLTPRGAIVADPGTGATGLEGVFAGGDIVTGAATVIQAMGAGKDAAKAIDAYLSGKDA